MDRKSIITGFVVLIITGFSCSSSQEDQRRRLSDISFTEELKILSDGSEFETRFDYIYDLAVGPAGNIFVADRSRLHVFKYSPGGAFITSFGGEGKGPGELVSLSGFGLIDSTVYVWDQNMTRMNLYDLQGEPVDQVQLEGILSTVEIVKVGQRRLLLYPERFDPPFEEANLAHLYDSDLRETNTDFMKVGEVAENLEDIGRIINTSIGRSIEVLSSEKILYTPLIYDDSIYEYRLNDSGSWILTKEHEGQVDQKSFSLIQNSGERRPDISYHSVDLNDPIEIIIHNQSRGLFKVQDYIFHFVQMDLGDKREFGAEVYTESFDSIGFIPMKSIPINNKRGNSLIWRVEQADSQGNFYFWENYPDSSRVRKMHLDLAELDSYR